MVMFNSKLGNYMKLLGMALVPEDDKMGIPPHINGNSYGKMMMVYRN